MFSKKDVCMPGVNSGFIRRGVIGPFTVEMLCLLQAVLNEISVGFMSGCREYSHGIARWLIQGRF